MSDGITDKETPKCTACYSEFGFLLKTDGSCITCAVEFCV